MLEGQTFTPAAFDLHSLLLAASTLPRPAIEAGIEGLIALLDARDGDADSEDSDDDSCVDDHGEDDRSSDEEAGSTPEQIEQGYVCGVYADDDREEDLNDLALRLPHRDRIRQRRCIRIRDWRWPFELDGPTPPVPFGREAAAMQPAAL